MYFKLLRLLDVHDICIACCVESSLDFDNLSIWAVSINFDLQELAGLRQLVHRPLDIVALLRLVEHRCNLLLLHYTLWDCTRCVESDWQWFMPLYPWHMVITFQPTQLQSIAHLTGSCFALLSSGLLLLLLLLVLPCQHRFIVLPTASLIDGQYRKPVAPGHPRIVLVILVTANDTEAESLFPGDCLHQLLNILALLLHC